MGEEQNGSSTSRLDRLGLDRMAGLMQLLHDDHLKFSDEHNRLLTAQILLTDRLDQVAVAMRQLSEQQKHTDARMDALISVVDDIIRKRPR